LNGLQRLRAAERLDEEHRQFPVLARLEQKDDAGLGRVPSRHPDGVVAPTTNLGVLRRRTSDHLPEGREQMMRKALVLTAILCALLVGLPGVAFATDPGTHGQPNQSCEDQPSTPGGGSSANSPGSPFTGGVSDGKYAGSQPQNSKNATSVSQYDVACFQVSQPGHA
jgi:hypothetical protein